MRFQMYLTEGRSEELTIDEFVKLAPRCKDSLNAYLFNNNGTLYRGVSQHGKNADKATVDSLKIYGNYMSVDPSKFTREPNFAQSKMYFVMIQNLPSWSKFPDRAKSVVGGTQGGKHSMYNSRGGFAMFPANGSNIAVCSDQDLWSSFRKVFKTGEDDELLGSFIDGLLTSLSYIEGEGEEGSPFHDDVKTMAELKAFAKRFDEGMKKRKLGDVLGKMNYYMGHAEYLPLDAFLREHYKGDLIDALNTAFDPAKNGIKLHKAGTKMPSGREWWTDGFCLMMHEDIYNSSRETNNDNEEDIAKIREAIK